MRNRHHPRARPARAFALAAVTALAAALAALTGPVASAQQPYTQYPLVSSGPGPSALAAGPDGNVWFTVSGGSAAIGQITGAGAVALFSQGLSSQPYQGLGAITAGPDGNVWFVEKPGGSHPAGLVGSITPAGLIHETANGLVLAAQPTGIATGADGNLWITDSGPTPTLVALAPSGSYQDFTSLALAAAQISDPTAGPDGNIWFVVSGGLYGGTGAIGRVTPSGSVSVFSAGLTPNGGVAALANGPGGNIWFTQTDAGNGGVGYITPGGTITELPHASFAGTQPLGIAAAADGNLYVSESAGAGAVVQVTPAGAVSVVASSPQGHPGAVIAEPGGDVWVAQTGKNTIGRVGIVPAGGSGTSSGSGSTGTTGASASAGSTGATGATGATSATGATGSTASTRRAGTSGSGGDVTGAASGAAGPPVLGTSAEVVAAGFVLASTTPGGPLVQLTGATDIPVGSLVDARSGTVRLVMAMGGGRTQAVDVGHGRFVVRQSRSGHGMTALALAGGGFAACAPAHATRGVSAHAARAAAKPHHVVRELWAKDNHGKFQTFGNNSVATVRGTEWVTEDRCDGTLTRVIRGVVAVRPRGSKRTVLVTAGHSYLAPARR